MTVTLTVGCSHNRFGRTKKTVVGVEKQEGPIAVPPASYYILVTYMSCHQSTLDSTLPMFLLAR